MADGDAIFAGVPKRDDVTYIALALNLRGVERAMAAGAKEINYVFCAVRWLLHPQQWRHG